MTYYRRYQGWRIATETCCVRRRVSHLVVGARRRSAPAGAASPNVYDVSRPPPDADAASRKHRRSSPGARNALKLFITMLRPYESMVYLGPDSTG